MEEGISLLSWTLRLLMTKKYLTSVTLATQDDHDLQAKKICDSYTCKKCESNCEVLKHKCNECDYRGTKQSSLKH